MSNGSQVRLVEPGDVSLLDEFRGVHDRGDGGYGVRLAAARVGRQARSDNDLVVSIRRILHGSHLIRGTADADLFITTAVDAYRQARGITDPDWALLVAGGLVQEYREQQARRKALAEQRASAEDPMRAIRAEQRAWVEQVARLSEETGLEYEFVAEFLRAFHAASRPRHPGIIDPRGVPAIGVLGAQRYGVAKVIKDFVLPGVGIVEGITGRDILTGERLAVWERVLFMALDVLPFARRGVRPVGRAARGAVRTAVQLGRTAAEWAVSAVRLGVTARAMLRTIGRLARLPAGKVRNLLARIRAARRARQPLELSAEDQQLLKEIEEAFQEFHGQAKASPRLKAPAARGFIFLSRMQAQVLGRLLGRPLARSVRPAVRATLQAADDIAESLRVRIRAHWDAGVPKGGSVMTAAGRVFRELRKRRPSNPNKFVRERLYNLWRNRALRRIYRDAQLRAELREQAGIIVGRNPKTGTISLHIRTQGHGGRRVRTPIDFDHGQIRHADAVADAIRTGDFSHLVSTVASSNLQLMTGRENRNFIEALREALRAMGGS